jgi:glycosyltransferase involved in cell wall biosynthesis
MIALDQFALAELLRGADIYVSTSRSDSTSVSLLEAMASGAFPVVTDIPGNRVWIAHSENGLLFPAGDSDALASCIRRAVKDTQLRLRAATVNRRRVLADAVWEDNMLAIERALTGLAG